MEEQISLFNDNPEYQAFLEKFQTKKTTDDCYTPPAIYEVIKEWVCNKYGVNTADLVRPFYPGGDYERYNYQPSSVVLDNPPFSILSKICEFYVERDIKFFLFAPSLTCMSWRAGATKINHIICDCNITYENGAMVRTSFLTNLSSGIVAETAPDLTAAVNAKNKELLRKVQRELPKYSDPDHIVTAAMMQRYSKYGINFKVLQRDCQPIYKLDSQAELKKTIYGGGLLLSDRAAAEKAAAHIWELSARELDIVKTLGG